MKQKQMLVPESFMVDVYKLLLHIQGDVEFDNPDEIIKNIQAVIDVKIEAQKRRQDFTNYKTSKPNSEQREQERQTYLDNKGIHKDWRTQKETPQI